MKTRNTSPSLLFIAASGLTMMSAPVMAAEISKSTTAPAVGALDLSNNATPTGTQKWFDDVEHDAGQTFTPTADGLLVSFTIFLSSGNPNDGGAENVDVRFGTISRPDGVFTFTDLYVENAVMAPSPEGDWEAGDYITFTFDTPQPVTAGVEYGIITDAQNMGNWREGIPYRHRTSNVYDGGVMINRGGEAANADLVFHAEIVSGTTKVFALDINPNAENPGTYDLSWNSKDGTVYKLVSSTDLSTAPSEWPVWEGNENIAGTAPANTLPNISGVDAPKRFFAVVEMDPPTDG